MRRALPAAAAAAAATGAVAAALWRDGDASPPQQPRPWDDPSARPAPRAAQLAALRSPAGFDVLVIGGGATGTGVALDAATRGLSVALVEGDDFGGATSSRSTKLVHGGVRYLEKAVAKMDGRQLGLVFEALRERAHFLAAAPHLTQPLPTVLPCYARWEVPYYWLGLRAYDLAAGLRSPLPWSSLLGPQGAARLLPTLAPARAVGVGAAAAAAVRQEPLRGAVVYWDAQFDDARTAVALAATAALAGAAVANHVRVVALLRDGDGEGGGRVVGAVCEDALAPPGGGANGGPPPPRFTVRARVVVNAAGPFVDEVRAMAAAAAAAAPGGGGGGGQTQAPAPRPPPVVAPSSGAHIVLPLRFGSPSHALIVPRTADGRVVFMLPWLGAQLAGTTDAPAAPTAAPRASSADVDFILSALAPLLAAPPGRGDVLSAWAGLRPLAAPGGGGGGEGGGGRRSEDVVRDHVVVQGPGGLVTVAGGKWTTYRAMAADAVDAALRELRSQQTQQAQAQTQAQAQQTPLPPAVTRGMPLVGARGWHPGLASELAGGGAGAGAGAGAGPGLAPDVAAHLARAYGDRAPAVLALARAQAASAPAASAAAGRRGWWRRLRGGGAPPPPPPAAAAAPAAAAPPPPPPPPPARLAPGWPVLEAEVAWAARSEFCCSAADFLSRRCRLAFLDAAAARAAAPRVVELLGNELGWGEGRRAGERVRVAAFLDQFDVAP